jgi:hypothetical protein
LAVSWPYDKTVRTYQYLQPGEEYHKKQLIVENYRSKFNSRYSYLLPNVQVLAIYEDISQPQTPSHVTISLPVCNQVEIIAQILMALLNHCEIASNLVIILDACRDDSKAKVIQTIEKFDLKSSITRIIILESKEDLFESTCENIALELLDSNYFMSLQADIYYCDATFLSRGIAFFEKYSDLLGLSGRAIIPASNRKPDICRKYLNKVFNIINALFARTIKQKFLSPFYSNSLYFGDLSTPPHSKMRYSRKQFATVYLGDSIIRGPVIWRSFYLKKLGLFSDHKYFLGGDEREMSVQGFDRFNYRVGFLATTCFTNLWTGTSHNPQKRTTETLQILNRRKELQQLNGGNFLHELTRIDNFENSKGSVYRL